jgi:myo-inositol 2-dehydrogenase/D-chiro-inositol 1-dehydrogenase
VHIETLSLRLPEAEVVAVTDPLQEEATRIAALYDIPSVVPDYAGLLEDDRVEAVVICSPTDTHAAYIIKAAQARKQIFCEKPIDLSLEVIRNALDEVEKYGVRMMVGFNRRFDPGFKRAQRMVAAGKLGEPELLRITSRDSRPPPAGYIAGSGGMFLDMTIHDFDLARYVMGSEIIEVYARAAVLVDPEIGAQGDVDTAVITLSFASGALGVIDNSRRTCYGYDQRLEIFGSGGMVRVENCRTDTHELFNEQGTHQALPLDFFMDRYIEAYAGEMKAFVQGVTAGERLPVSGEDGLRSVAIGLAAGKSAAEHRPVEVSEILG